ncbi:CAP-Gly domain-containing linker protein 1 [Trichonephila clavipes]|nr:CAP-Gly domain-containing linker protein 1 [Trichonephila clavipes]
MTETCFAYSAWYKLIGQRVCIKGINYGTLRYFGKIICNDGLWCGIELDEPIGETDGISNNVRYFTCKDNYGIFVPLHEVTKLNDRVKTDTELCFTNNITKESDVNYFASGSNVCKTEDSFMKPCEIPKELQENYSNHNSNVDLNKTFDIFKPLEPEQLSDIAETSFEGLDKYTFSCINEKESLPKKSEQENIDRLDSEESLGIISDLLTEDMTFDLCKAAQDFSDQNLNKIGHNLDDSSLSVFSPPNNYIDKVNLFLKNFTTPLDFENEHRCSSTPKPSVNSQFNIKETNVTNQAQWHFLQDENDVEPVIAGSNQIKFKIDFDVDEFKNSHPLTSTSKAFSPPRLISSLLLSEGFDKNSEGGNSTLQELFEMKEETRDLNVTQTLSCVDKINCDKRTGSIQNCPDLLNCTFNIKPSVSLEITSLAGGSNFSSTKNLSSSIDGKLEKTGILNSTYVLSGDEIKCIPDCERTFVINYSPTKATNAKCSINLVEDITNGTFCEKSDCKTKTCDGIDLLQCDNNYVTEMRASVYPKQIFNVASENSDKELKFNYEMSLSLCDEVSFDKIKSVILPLVENANVESKSLSDDFCDESKHQDVGSVKFSMNGRNKTDGQFYSDKKEMHEIITNGTFSEHYKDEIQTSLSDNLSNELKVQKSTVCSTLIENAMVEIKVYDNSSKKLETQKPITSTAYPKNTNGEFFFHFDNDFSDVKTQQAFTEASFAEHESDNIGTNEETNLTLCTNVPSDKTESLKSQALIKNIFLENTTREVSINLNQTDIVSTEETSQKFSVVTNTVFSENTRIKTRYQHDSIPNCRSSEQTKFMKSHPNGSAFIFKKDGKKNKSFSKIHSFQPNRDVTIKSLAKPTKTVCPKKVKEISTLPVNKSNICKSKTANNKVKASEFNSTFSTSYSNSLSSDSKTVKEIKRASFPPETSTKVSNILRHRTYFKKPLQTSSKVNNELVPEFKTSVNGKKSNISTNTQVAFKSFSRSVHFTNAKDIEKVTKNPGTVIDNCKKVLKSTEQNIPKLLLTASLKAKYSELKSASVISCSVQRCDDILHTSKIADLPPNNDTLSEIEINKNSKKTNKDYSVSKLPVKKLSNTACNNNKNCISKPAIKEKDMAVPKVCQLGTSKNAVNEKILNIAKPRYSLLPHVKLCAKNTSEENRNEGSCNKMPSFASRKSVIPKNLSNEYEIPANKVAQFKNQINTSVEEKKENIRTSTRNSRLPLSSKSTKDTTLADIKSNFNRRLSLRPVSEMSKGSSSIARPNEAQNVLKNLKIPQIQDSQRIAKRLPQLQKLQSACSYRKY